MFKVIRLIFALTLTTALCHQVNANPPVTIKLPSPKEHKMSLEKAIKTRRSIRTFNQAPISLQQAAQLLWAAQGITSKQGLRAAPSAGGLYPLEIYLVANRVQKLKPDVYQYLPAKHALLLIKKGKKQKTLSKAAFQQSSIATAAANIIITAIYQRTERKYGPRARKYVYMEVGHAAQNIVLQTTSMGFGSVTIGAFNPTRVIQDLDLPKDHIPLYIIPIGKI